MFNTQVEAAPAQGITDGLSPLEVNTTNGMLRASTVPSLGMLSRHSLSRSNNIASNAWSTSSGPEAPASARPL